MISIENPRILKGNRITQINGKRNKSIRANGQHNTNKMHQSINVISVFIMESQSFGYQLSRHS
jgi:hypothetical protein